MENTFIVNEKPSFVQIIENTNSIIINGYTLIIDVGHNQASIINSTKGGKRKMLVPKRVAKDGWEDVFNLVEAKKENFDKELEDAKAEALAKVEQEFEEKRLDIEKFYLQATKEIFVEEPDEEDLTEEIVENEEVTE